MKPQIVLMMGDLRSSVVKAACHFVATMSETCGIAFAPMADQVLIAVLNTAFIKTRVVSQAGERCLESMSRQSRYNLLQLQNHFKRTKHGTYVQSYGFIRKIHTAGHVILVVVIIILIASYVCVVANVRHLCLAQLMIIMDAWTAEELDRYTALIQSMLLQALCDSDSRVREKAREAFVWFTECWHHNMIEACVQILMSQKAAMRDAVMREHPKSRLARALRQQASCNGASLPMNDEHRQSKMTTDSTILRPAHQYLLPQPSIVSRNRSLNVPLRQEAQTREIEQPMQEGHESPPVTIIHSMLSRSMDENASVDNAKDNNVQGHYHDHPCGSEETRVEAIAGNVHQDPSSEQTQQLATALIEWPPRALEPVVQEERRNVMMEDRDNKNHVRTSPMIENAATKTWSALNTTCSVSVSTDRAKEGLVSKPQRLTKKRHPFMPVILQILLIASMAFCIYGVTGGITTWYIMTRIDYPPHHQYHHQYHHRQDEEPRSSRMDAMASLHALQVDVARAFETLEASKAQFEDVLAQIADDVTSVRATCDDARAKRRSRDALWRTVMEDEMAAFQAAYLEIFEKSSGHVRQ